MNNNSNLTEKVVTSSAMKAILERSQGKGKGRWVWWKPSPRRVRRKGKSQWVWFQVCFIGRYSQAPLNYAKQGAGRWHKAPQVLSVYRGEQIKCLQVSWQTDKSGRQTTRWSMRCKWDPQRLPGVIWQAQAYLKGMLKENTESSRIRFERGGWNELSLGLNRA